MNSPKNIYKLTNNCEKTQLFLKSIDYNLFDLEIYDLVAQKLIARAENPPSLYVFDGKSIQHYATKYDKVEENENKLMASATISLGNVIFQITDQFTQHPTNNGFQLTREVIICSKMDNIGGFLSTFELELPGNHSDFLWFAPGVWYHDNRHVTQESIGASQREITSDGLWIEVDTISNVIREDRLPLPIFLAFNRNSYRSIALIHTDASGDTIRMDDMQRILIDERLQFGALGERHRSDKTWICFWFPGSEGDISYPPMWVFPVACNKQSELSINPFRNREDIDATRNAWSYRFHPIKNGVKHQYTIAILNWKYLSYIDSIRKVWRLAFDIYQPTAHQVDLEAIYTVSLSLLSQMVKYSVSRTNLNITPVGIPTWVDCFTGQTGRLQNTFAIGFVGRNIEAGYLLLKAGREQNNEQYINRGMAIIDFWANCSGMGLSHTEFDVLTENWIDAGQESNGQQKVFLRQESEGHHECLKAWELEKSLGFDHPKWFEWIHSYAEWLVQHQNHNGSFYRSYTLEGFPTSDITSDCAHVIEFLVDFSRVTRTQKYMETAIRTGVYLYNNFHREGHFVGGTLDNPNCYDKEACIIALEAYLALYKATNERIWLQAAEIAGTFAETWIYMWDIPMPIDESERFYSSHWTTVGLQLITCGCSAVDMYLSRHAYTFRELARLTCDEHYDKVAKILHFNTKGMVQVDDICGKNRYFGYAFPGFQIEHWGMGRGRGFGLNSGWLPWVTTGHLIDIEKWEKDS